MRFFRGKCIVSKLFDHRFLCFKKKIKVKSRTLFSGNSLRVSGQILSQLISVDFGHGSRFLITRSFMSIGFETLLNLNRNWMNRKSARLSKGMRIYIFETNNLSAYYAQSNNSTHDLTIKVFCILHQTYLFVHSVEKGSKVISPGTWQLNTTKFWSLEN